MVAGAGAFVHHWHPCDRCQCPGVAARWMRCQSLINVPGADRLMVLAWINRCLRTDRMSCLSWWATGAAPRVPPSALRRLIDPNRADLRAAPKPVEDVWIAARNPHMVSLENLSHLHPQYQDALCACWRPAAATRRAPLYTNAEENHHRTAQAHH